MKITLGVIFILFVTFLSHSSADELTLYTGEKIEGIILSDKGNEIAIQINTRWRTFHKGEIESVDVWDPRKNEKLKSQWARQGFTQKLKKAIKGGPKGILHFLKPYHHRLLKWVESTRVYDFFMQGEFFQEFKEENPTGFNLSIYCNLLVLLAIGIKLTKEAILLILGLFGITADK